VTASPMGSALAPAVPTEAATAIVTAKARQVGLAARAQQASAAKVAELAIPLEASAMATLVELY